MALVEMIMPKMGESIMEGTILTWLKKEGDTIEQDESVLEVATDKVDTEVPATHAGVLKEILVGEGDVVPVGQAIAIIQTEIEEKANSSGTSPLVEDLTFEEAETIENEIETVQDSIQSVGDQGRFYSPLVMNIARKENISLIELEQIPGTGKDKRLTKNDILKYIENRSSVQSTISSKNTVEKSIPQAKIETPVKKEVKDTNPSPSTQIAFNGEYEIIEMDRMRKMIAERMVASKQTSPHVTSFVEADVTNLVFWRRKIKDEFIQKEGEPITYMPMFVEAIVKALKDYPMMNISVVGDNIIKKKDINIGIAVALPSGNLIVPVIKQADQYNMVGLAKKINSLAKRARENKLSPDDLSDGTYTVSNVGSFGNVLGTPIIMQPQVGILAIGAIRKKPAVIETPYGDTIGIRHLLFLSHSYDHRVVDGALGGMFVRKVADYLEHYDTSRNLY